MKPPSHTRRVAFSLWFFAGVFDPKLWRDYPKRPLSARRPQESQL